MGIIKEEIRHKYIDAVITVVEKEKEETVDRWKFASIEMNSMESLSPVDLRELGKWLIKEGKRLGKEYKSNGSKKQ